MKLLIIISLLFIQTHFVMAQSKNLPPDMLSQFRFRYPHAGNVEWKSSHKGYEAVFVLNNSNMTANFSPQGEWQQTCKETVFEKLPADVQNGFNRTKYKGWNIVSIQEVQSMSEPLQFNISVTKSGLLKKHLLFQVNEGLVNVH